MNRLQKSIIFGSLLGDGSIEKHNNNGVFRIERSIKDIDYLLWEYERLKNVCRKEPTKRVRMRWGKPLESIRFHTRSLPYFGHLRNVFYKNGRRILNQRILSDLDEQALAIWFMDDGCTNIVKVNGSYARRVYLCLQRYTDKERDIVIDYFKRKWKITGWRKEKSGNIIIGSQNGEKFLQLVKPYILTCMKRKIKEHPNTSSHIGKDIV